MIFNFYLHFFNYPEKKIINEKIIIEYFNYIKPKINTESIFRLLSPILQIFFGIPNSKKFKTDIHDNMKNHKINELEQLNHSSKQRSMSIFPFLLELL